MEKIIIHLLTTQPKFSVIIPAYNSEAYIAKAIESALNQTVNNTEIIVVDDFSKDATVEIAKSFSDFRLRIFVNPKNFGAGFSRNYAIQQARGEWIALLDSDDWYAPERLEKLLQIANVENADIVADNLLLIRNEENYPHATQADVSSEKIKTLTQVDTLKFLQADTCGKAPLFSCTKPIIRREFLVEHNIAYDTDIAWGEDFRLYLRCLVHGTRFFFTPEAYYFQRLRQGSLTTQNAVDILSGVYRGNQDLLEEEFIQQHPEVVNFLLLDAQILKRNLSYYAVVELLKQRKWLNALTAIIHNPSFLINFTLQLPQNLSRRLS